MPTERSSDAISQPARRADHRNRTVLQAVQLVQAGRFIAAGHQEDVCASLDPMRQAIGELKPHRHAVTHGWNVLTFEAGAARAYVL